MKKFFIFSVLFSSSFLFLVSGCIEIHAFFELKPDGSGRGKIIYVVTQGIYTAPEGSKLAINEERIAEVVAKKEGVKVIKTGSSFEGNNLIRVWVEFEFKDISKLSDSYARYRIEDLGDGKKELHIIYRFVGELHKREILKEAFRGLNSSLEVKVPGKVISTNGKIIASDRVRWEIDARDIVGKTEDRVFVVEYRVEEGFFKSIIRKIRDLL